MNNFVRWSPQQREFGGKSSVSHTQEWDGEYGSQRPYMVNGKRGIKIKMEFPPELSDLEQMKLEGYYGIDELIKTAKKYNINIPENELEHEKEIKEAIRRTCHGKSKHYGVPRNKWKDVGLDQSKTYVTGSISPGVSYITDPASGKVGISISNIYNPMENGKSPGTRATFNEIHTMGKSAKEAYRDFLEFERFSGRKEGSGALSNKQIKDLLRKAERDKNLRKKLLNKGILIPAAALATLGTAGTVYELHKYKKKKGKSK